LKINGLEGFKLVAETETQMLKNCVLTICKYTKNIDISKAEIDMKQTILSTIKKNKNKPDTIGKSSVFLCFRKEVNTF